MSQMNLDDTLLEELKKYMDNNSYYSKLRFQNNTARVRQLIIDNIREDHIRKVFRDEVDRILSRGINV